MFQKKFWPKTSLGIHNYIIFQLKYLIEKKKKKIKKKMMRKFKKKIMSNEKNKIK
uniref:Uncharacterized protein n=1 Tax=Rhizophagus irregularis (strain DAOM 181602 / DAOM 197198 / MUCL 43194) TaxID=747089 RepID=U9SJH6_RHIID